MAHAPVVHIVGARPQFVKAAAVLAAGPGEPAPILVHTGQHYDAHLSRVFFDELRLPAPDHHLGVGSGSHGAQVGAMLIALEQTLGALMPGVAVVYGDTNSTLAGAIIAARLGWTLVHVEAGLRSFDRSMPEEQNRVVCDHLSDHLLCPTARSVKQLEVEGLGERVHFVGDVMFDIARAMAERARTETAVGQYLNRPIGPPPGALGGLRASEARPGGYVLATVHRAANTDDADRLRAIFAGLNRLERPVVLPLHPRTRAALARHGIDPGADVHCVPPAGYLDFAALLSGAGHVVTDSGGVQKEALFAGRPCTTLRAETEWPETLVDGWNALVDADPAALRRAVQRDTPSGPPPTAAFGDGAAAEAISALLARLSRR